MFGFGRKDEHGQQVRLEHRGKHIRLSRTGDPALRAQGKVLDVNATVNTTHGLRLSTRIAKGARVALQNGKFRLIGRWRSGPLAFNLSKSGVSASVKNEAGTINLLKPQYSSYKAAGIQIRGKKAVRAHIAYIVIKAIFALAVLAIALIGILLWAVAFLCLFFWDFFAGMFGRGEEEAVVIDVTESAEAPEQVDSETEAAEAPEQADNEPEAAEAPEQTDNEPEAAAQASETT